MWYVYGEFFCTALCGESMLLYNAESRASLLDCANILWNILKYKNIIAILAVKVIVTVLFITDLGIKSSSILIGESTEINQQLFAILFWLTWLPWQWMVVLMSIQKLGGHDCQRERKSVVNFWGGTKRIERRAFRWYFYIVYCW